MSGAFPWDGKERPTDPDLPAIAIDTSLPVPMTRVINVDADYAGYLQLAINAAQPGDTIVLTSGSVYLAPAAGFQLPYKSGTEFITIVSSAFLTSAAPAAVGTRVAPSMASRMATIRTNTNWASVETQEGAHHFRFTGIRFDTTTMTGSINAIMRIHAPSLAGPGALPHHIWIDRCFFDGPGLTLPIRRAIFLDGDHLAVTDSYISGIADPGQDSQALSGFESNGPIKVVNNFLEGLTENFIFGGSDPRIASLVVHDIEFRSNHVYKRDAFVMSGSSKNLFELKNGVRVLVEGNVFDGFSERAQNTAVNLKSTNQGGMQPLAETSHITFRRNLFRRLDSGVFKVSPGDNIATFGAVQPHDVLFADNCVDGNINTSAQNWVLQLNNDPAFPMPRVQLRRFTGVGNANTFLVFGATGGGAPGFAVEDVIAGSGQYGIKAPGRAAGTASLEALGSGNWRLNRVVLVGPSTSGYPAGVEFVPSVSGVGFVNFVATGGGDLHLARSSSLADTGVTATDPGCNVDVVLAATSGVMSTELPQ